MLIELFDKICEDGTVAVTGDPGCAKSFNVELLLLFFHTHGYKHQLSGLLCNQKTHAQAWYKNAWKAMQFYEKVTGIKQPLDDPSSWPFLLVTGDEVKGDRHFNKLRLVINTAATSDDSGSVGMLMPLMATLFGDEYHENNLPGMIRNSVCQHGVDMSPCLDVCSAMTDKGFFVEIN